MSAPPPEPVRSPCTGLCRLDAATGWCLGCGRSGDEIALWPAASEAEARAILAALPPRLKRLRAARPPR